MSAAQLCHVKLPGLEQYALKLHSASFTLAAKLLAPDTKSQIETLYRLCRAIDDAADEKSGHEGMAIAPLEALKVALQTQQAHPWLRNIDALPGNPIARQNWLLRLTKTCLADVVINREIADEQALLDYAYGVAGTVGLMLVPMLGVADANRVAARHACALGMAMQLSNIARDVVADAKIGRVYLPQSWLLAPLDIAALAQGKACELEKCVPALVRVLALAEVLYRAGMNGLHHIPARNRAAISVAARVYREIGRQVQRELGALGFARRTVVSKPRKFLLCLSGLWGSLIGASSSTEANAELAVYVQPLLKSDGYAC